MVAYVFDRILAKGVRAGQLPARTQGARDWFREAARKTSASPEGIMRGADKSDFANSGAFGAMFMFYYDPKHKATLPYYDTFPLVFPFSKAPGGFMGLNMHYLPLRLRARLMDALYETSSNDKYDDTTKLRLSYNILNASARYKYYKPTVHHYLTDHLRSRLLRISSSDWDTALFLPVERFEKASKTKVWADSRKAV